VKWNHFTHSDTSRALKIANTARALIVTNNFTDLDAGAISGTHSKLDIGDSHFSELSAKEGAAISAVNCITSAAYSLFRLCAVVPGRGGGMFVSGGNFSGRWLNFQGNRANGGNSIFSKNSEVFLQTCAFSGSRIDELSGPSFTLQNVTFLLHREEKWGPTDSRTFTPHQTSVILRYSVSTEEPFPDDNTKLIAACAGGVGGLIIIVTVVAILIVRARGSHNPQIYATEMSDKAPPSGTMYVTRSAANTVSKSKSKSKSGVVA
jgi:hypothetical protein